MGTSAVVTTKSRHAGEVSFYSHWDGYAIAGIVARALDRGRARWDDPSYENRIVFCQMIKELGDGSLDDLTGFGISSDGGVDGEYTVTIDYDHQTVIYRADNEITFSLEEFVEKYKNDKV